MVKDGIQNLFDPEPAQIIKENDFILEDQLIDLEAQNAIYIT